MVRHVVNFEFVKEYEGKSAIEHAEIIKERLLSLTEKIDFIRRMEVGVNSKDAEEGNATLCLICDFDTFEDLNRYAVHPEHLKVGELIKAVKIARSCVDYEI